MTISDMVFDRNMNPAHCSSPESTRAWLQYQLGERGTVDVRGYTVRTGWTQELLSVEEYLRRGRNK